MKPRCILVEHGVRPPREHFEAIQGHTGIDVGGRVPHERVAALDNLPVSFVRLVRAFNPKHARTLNIAGDLQGRACRLQGYVALQDRVPVE